MGRLVLAMLAVVLLAAVVSLRRRRDQRRLTDERRLRLACRAAAEDVAALGEHLSVPRPDPAPDQAAARAPGGTWVKAPGDERRRAVADHLRAARLVREATTAEDVRAATAALAHAGWALACLTAHCDLEPVPERRTPCFLDPQHGPAAQDASWALPGGVEMWIPVCQSDAYRIAGGIRPEARLVWVDGRWMPWFAAGPAYDAYAHGYFGDTVDAQRAEAARRLRTAGVQAPT
jgi:hypothetical protein